MDDEPRYWYGARRYLWGRRQPLTWEGWLVDIGFLATILGISPYARALTHPFKSLGLVFGLIALYAVIAHWKGEPNDRDG
jgi:hypothetical protein